MDEFFWGSKPFLIKLNPIYFHLKGSQKQLFNDPIFISFLAITTLILYLIQLNKLKFKTAVLKTDLEIFKNKLRTLLLDENWEIRYDNKKYLQANYKGGVFHHDMITIVYGKNGIKFNAIFHPHTHSPIGSMLSSTRKGKGLIKKIKLILK